jgi:hypothetical protein
MSSMPPDLDQLLEKYLAELPFWKRWLVRGALAVARPKGSPLLGCLVLVVLAAAVVGILWQFGCWLKWGSNLCP